MPSELRVDKVSSTTSPYTPVFSTTGGALSHRNMIINGAMQVAQRGTSSTGLGGSAGYFTCDRWRHVFNTSGRLTSSQDSDAPNGFGNSLKFACTTADTSIASNEYFFLQQKIEGQNLQSFAKGTSDAKAFMVSFYVKGNASATYVCELYDSTNTRQISKTFNVTTSWSRVELSFPADTTGALNNDNLESMNLAIWLHAGDTYTSGTINSSAWASNTQANRVGSGTTSFFDSTARTFQLTGLQLELGTVATPFEHRTFAEELLRCQHYFSKSGLYATSPGQTSDGRTVTTSIDMAVSLMRTPYIYFPVNMRTAPTVTLLQEGAVQTGSSGDWAWFENGSWQNGSFSASGVTEIGYSAHRTDAGAGDGNAYYMHINWTASAEL